MADIKIIHEALISSNAYEKKDIQSHLDNVQSASGLSDSQESQLVDSYYNCSQTNFNEVSCSAQAIQSLGFDATSLIGIQLTQTEKNKIKLEDGGVLLIRAFVEKHYPESKKYNFKKLKQTKDDFKKYYEAVKKEVPLNQKANLKNEYEALNQYGFTRDFLMTATPYIDEGMAITVGAVNVGIGTYNLVGQSDVLADKAPIPVNPFSGYQFSNGNPDFPITPYERKNLAKLQLVTDSLFTLATILPEGNLKELANPVAAGESKAPVKFINEDITKDTLRSYIVNLGDFFEADAVGTISRKRLDGVEVHFFENQAAEQVVDATFSVVKSAAVSKARSEVFKDILRTKFLSFGSDGDECTSATPETLEAIRERNPGLAKKSDKTLINIFCSTQETGTNLAMPAMGRALRYSIMSRYTGAQLNTALLANLRFYDNENMAAGLAVAALRPLANQAPNIESGFNLSQLIFDYTLEAVAAGEMAAIGNFNDKAPAYAAANDEAAKSLYAPDFNLTLEPHVIRTDDTITNMSRTVFFGGALFDTLGSYFHAELAGEVLAEGDIGPALIIAGSQVLRKGIFAERLIPDSADVSNRRIRQLQSEINSGGGIAWLPEITSPVAAIAGLAVGHSSSQTQASDIVQTQPIAFGENGIIGGAVDINHGKNQANWGIVPEISSEFVGGTLTIREQKKRSD